MIRFVHRSLPAALASVGLALVISGCAGTADVQQREVSKIDFATFQQRMVGDWAMIGEDGKPMPGPALSSHTTAGGSAIVEKIFPGQDHEMVSVYYQDGAQILMTHYCALGNAPHMLFSPESDEETWIFTCDGHGSNFAETDLHMHSGVITWLGPDRFRSSWTTHQDGEANGSVEFEMVRVD